MSGNSLLLLCFLVLSAPLTAAALFIARRQYRDLGRLTLSGLGLLCLMLLMPMLMLEYATRYTVPRTLLDYVGVVVGLAGLALVLAGIVRFDSTARVLCLRTDRLSTSGPYRWSRNPQYVGSLLLVLGFALNDWSPWCLAALLVLMIQFHLLVRVEEEHLRRRFGERYAEYCGKVPRYARWGRVRI